MPGDIQLVGKSEFKIQLKWSTSLNPTNVTYMVYPSCDRTLNLPYPIYSDSLQCDDGFSCSSFSYLSSGVNYTFCVHPFYPSLCNLFPYDGCSDFGPPTLPKTFLLRGLPALGSPILAENSTLTQISLAVQINDSSLTNVIYSIYTDCSKSKIFQINIIIFIFTDSSL